MDRISGSAEFAFGTADEIGSYAEPSCQITFPGNNFFISIVLSSGNSWIHFEHFIVFFLVTFFAMVLVTGGRV